MPAWVSASIARTRASARFPSRPWTRSGSATISPIRHARVQRLVRVLEDHLHGAPQRPQPGAAQPADVVPVGPPSAPRRAPSGPAAGCRSSSCRSRTRPRWPAPRRARPEADAVHGPHRRGRAAGAAGPPASVPAAKRLQGPRRRGSAQPRGARPCATCAGIGVVQHEEAGGPMPVAFQRVRRRRLDVAAVEGVRAARGEAAAGRHARRGAAACRGWSAGIGPSRSTSGKAFSSSWVYGWRGAA